MARRLTAIVALLAIVALALTLLWRVYGHHQSTGNYGDEGVLTNVRLERAPAEKFAQHSA